VVYLSPQENKRLSTVERCHLQHNFNISNHSSSHGQLLLAHKTFVSPCPKVSETTPKTYRSWSRKRNSIKGTWYVECDIVSPTELRESTPIQLSVVRGKTPTTNHKDNVQDLFSYISHSPVTLADIGLSEERKELAMTSLCKHS
jgi:hypothetical protein